VYLRYPNRVHPFSILYSDRLLATRMGVFWNPATAKEWQEFADEQSKSLDLCWYDGELHWAYLETGLSTSAR
jgi:hypothetical protein